MKESTQLVRQWKLLQLLEASHTGCTISNLVNETEVSDKTIRRDIKVLQTVFDIRETTGDKGLKRWTMKPLAKQVGFNFTELLSMYMSQQFLEPMVGTPFWEGNRSVLRKVKNSIGENAVRYIEKLSAGLQATSIGSSD